MIATMLLQPQSQYAGSTYDFSESAYVGESYISGACISLMEGICDCDMQYMIADTIGTGKVLLEKANPAAMLKNVAGGGFAKLKEVFKTFKAKVVAYFKKVIDFFKSMFSSGKKFVSEFGKALENKAKTTTFQYTGYPYDCTGGDKLVEKVKTAGSEAVNKLVTGFSDIAALSGKTTAEIKNAIQSDVAGDVSDIGEFTEEFIKEAGIGGAASSTDMKNEIKKKYHGGKTTKVEGLTLTTADVTAMCDLISGNKQQITSFKNDMDTFTKQCDMIMTKLNSVEKDGDQDTAYKVASTVSSCVSAVLTVVKSAHSVRVDMHREATRAAIGLLKRFYMYKPAKESYLFETDDIADEFDMESNEVMIDTDNDLKEMEAARAECEACDNDNDDEPEVNESTSLFEQASAFLF